MKRVRRYNRIPTTLREDGFNEFVLPHLKKGTRGPSKKIAFFKLFNYILKLMHTGCQWEQIPIDKNKDGKPEIHYTSIYKAFKFWTKHGGFDKLFEASVARLFKAEMLDTDILHGDGTCTSAKKGVITWGTMVINTLKETRLYHFVIETVMLSRLL